MECECYPERRAREASSGWIRDTSKHTAAFLTLVSRSIEKNPCCKRTKGFSIEHEALIHLLLSFSPSLSLSPHLIIANHLNARAHCHLLCNLITPCKN